MAAFTTAIWAGRSCSLIRRGTLRVRDLVFMVLSCRCEDRRWPTRSSLQADHRQRAPRDAAETHLNGAGRLGRRPAVTAGGRDAERGHAVESARAA